MNQIFELHFTEDDCTQLLEQADTFLLLLERNMENK